MTMILEHFQRDQTNPSEKTNDRNTKDS